MAFPDLYAVFNVSQTASTSTIRSRFHHLLKIWHPDKLASRNTTTSSILDSPGLQFPAHLHGRPFFIITTAHHILSNATLRTQYDEFYHHYNPTVTTAGRNHSLYPHFKANFPTQKAPPWTTKGRLQLCLSQYNTHHDPGQFRWCLDKLLRGQVGFMGMEMWEQASWVVDVEELLGEARVRCSCGSGGGVIVVVIKTAWASAVEWFRSHLGHLNEYLEEGAGAGGSPRTFSKGF